MPALWISWPACALASARYLARLADIVLTRYPFCIRQTNLKIRAACEAKKPVEAAQALTQPEDVNATLLADGTVVAGPGARKMLRA